MTHDPHEAHWRYDPAQLLFDGCAECTRRSESKDRGISGLDAARFARAWERAAEFGRDRLSKPSVAEVPLLETLWAVQCALEIRGIPIGLCPSVLALRDLSDLSALLSEPGAGEPS